MILQLRAFPLKKPIKILCFVTKIETNLMQKQKMSRSDHNMSRSDHLPSKNRILQEF